MAPPDPLFGLRVAYGEDKREEKINLGIGTYMTSDLKPFILMSVKQAEEKMLQEEKNKDYLPIEGDSGYILQTKRLVFGEADQQFERIAGAQTVGGTGALRLAGVFFGDHLSESIFLPTPTWDNHFRIFQQTGLEPRFYPYYNQKEHRLDFGALMDALRTMPQKSVILFHGCCHNPTGTDPSEAQWKALFEEIRNRGVFPLFDLAYQGFGEGLDQDVQPIRQLLDQGHPFAVAVSHSKNFGLYAERTGALFFVCPSAVEAKKISSQIKVLIRGMYSNPPCHGARIVYAILSNKQARAHWEKELGAMRERLIEMRKALVGALQVQTGSFEFIAEQKGMFSYTGLKEDFVSQLISEYAIYMPGDGRINVAGLNTENVRYVAESIAAVLKT